VSKTKNLISRTELWKMVNFSPNPPQELFLGSDARFKVACWGRRCGKSRAAGMELAEAAFKPNAYYWIVGPTYVLGEKEFRVVHDILINKLGLGADPATKVAYNVESGNMRIKLPWNTVIKVVSAERPRSLQGEGLDGVIMSESAEHHAITWDQYVRPALSDKRGWATFPSTPKGFNQFYDMWMQGIDPDFPDWESWQFPSWANTKVFSGEDDPEFVQIKRSMSDTLFDQEYGAKFTAYEGLIYPEFDPKFHVRSFDYEPAYRNYWTFDWGFSNPFVCLDVSVSPSDDVYVWREYYVKNRSILDHIKALKERENPDGFHVDAMFGDPAGAGDIATMGMLLGKVFAERVEVTEGIEKIKWLLKLQEPDFTPKLFIHPRCENLIREMHMLRMETNRTPGKNAPDKQHKFNDHACDALRYFANEYFIHGAGSSLASVMEHTNAPTMQSFFKMMDNEGFTMQGTQGAPSRF
jgi:hypothetical protein